MDYNLDLHCSTLLQEYNNLLPSLNKMEEIVTRVLNQCVNEAGICIDGIATRVKTEGSLAGKLAKKGYKYNTISDITDLVGARIITFYQEDVDKISSFISNYFAIDWENSVDKRKIHDLKSFGYASLHYICRIPVSLHHDPAHPEINQMCFEIQMRTCLQHVWATIEHDIGYKTDVEIPRNCIRNLTRLAGMLELADEQFSAIRNEVADYRRKVKNLVEDSKFDEILLDGDTWASYLSLNPFDKLTKRIASINQAEIIKNPLGDYIKVFQLLDFKTLGDVTRLLSKYSDDAFTLATHQIGRTDLDIISSSISLQNLCCIHVMRMGGGVLEIKKIFDIIDGVSPFNEERAKMIIEDAKSII